jgi:hypothetical protein
MLLSNLPKLRDKSIKVYSDNKHLKFTLQSGSNVEQLHKTCLDIILLVKRTSHKYTCKIYFPLFTIGLAEAHA